MNSIQIRNLEIGTGIPKICVPVTGTTKSEILKAAADLVTLPADLVEWRADFFENIFDLSQVLDILKELRNVLGGLPLLLTFRSAHEGGKKSIDNSNYISLIRNSISSGYLDLIDIEFFSAQRIAKELIDFAHENKVKVIVSNHDFEKTPSKEELISRLIKMQELGADLPKIAVMPQCRHDVLTLLSATEEMVSCYADRPIITMSMANLGTISRICGEYFGSAITFASAGTPSAPGQINVTELKNLLELFHTSLSKNSHD